MALDSGTGKYLSKGEAVIHVSCMCSHDRETGPENNISLSRSKDYHSVSSWIVLFRPSSSFVICGDIAFSNRLRLKLEVLSSDFCIHQQQHGLVPNLMCFTDTMVVFLRLRARKNKTISKLPPRSINHGGLY